MLKEQGRLIYCVKASGGRFSRFIVDLRWARLPPMQNIANYLVWMNHLQEGHLANHLNGHLCQINTKLNHLKGRKVMLKGNKCGTLTFTHWILTTKSISIMSNCWGIRGLHRREIHLMVGRGSTIRWRNSQRRRLKSLCFWKVFNLRRNLRNFLNKSSPSTNRKMSLIQTHKMLPIIQLTITSPTTMFPKGWETKWA